MTKLMLLVMFFVGTVSAQVLETSGSKLPQSARAPFLGDFDPEWFTGLDNVDHAMQRLLEFDMVRGQLGRTFDFPLWGEFPNSGESRKIFYTRSLQELDRVFIQIAEIGAVPINTIRIRVRQFLEDRMAEMDRFGATMGTSSYDQKAGFKQRVAVAVRVRFLKSLLENIKAPYVSGQSHGRADELRSQRRQLQAGLLRANLEREVKAARNLYLEQRADKANAQADDGSLSTALDSLKKKVRNELFMRSDRLGIFGGDWVPPLENAVIELYREALLVKALFIAICISEFGNANAVKSKFEAIVPEMYVHLPEGLFLEMTDSTPGLWSRFVSRFSTRKPEWIQLTEQYLKARREGANPILSLAQLTSSEAVRAVSLGQAYAMGVVELAEFVPEGFVPDQNLARFDIALSEAIDAAEQLSTSSSSVSFQGAMLDRLLALVTSYQHFNQFSANTSIVNAEAIPLIRDLKQSFLAAQQLIEETNGADAPLELAQQTLQKSVRDTITFLDRSQKRLEQINNHRATLTEIVSQVSQLHQAMESSLTAAQIKQIIATAAEQLRIIAEQRSPKSVCVQADLSGVGLQGSQMTGSRSSIAGPSNCISTSLSGDPFERSYAACLALFGSLDQWQ